MKDESADAADRQCGQHFLGAASAKVHGRMNPGKGSAMNGAKLVGIWDDFRRPLFGEGEARFLCGV